MFLSTDAMDGLGEVVMLTSSVARFLFGIDTPSAFLIARMYLVLLFVLWGYKH